MTLFLVIVAIVILLVRWALYQNSIAFKVRRGVQTEVATCRDQLKQWFSTLHELATFVDQARVLLGQAEAEVRERVMAPRRGSILTVENLRQFKGIGRDTVSLLQANGYATADRLNQSILRLPGIGPAKADRILAGASQLVTAARSLTPNDEELEQVAQASSAIGERFRSWEAGLREMKTGVEQDVQRWRAELQVREGLLKSLSPHSFWTYLFSPEKAETQVASIMMEHHRPLPSTDRQPPKVPAPPTGSSQVTTRTSPSGSGTSRRFVEVSPAKVSPKAVSPAPSVRAEIQYDRGSQFFVDSLKNRAPVTRPVPYVPFQEYWPTFQSLTLAQKDYYRWWRTEWLVGRKVPIDLSYVFIFVYELINFSFEPNRLRAFELLARLYEDYREPFPTLWNYAEWVGDLAWELGLEDQAIIWYSRDNTTADVALSLTRGQSPPLFGAENLLGIFGVRRSAHFAQHEQEIIEVLDAALTESDLWCQEQLKRSLLEVLAGGAPQKSTRSLYPSAVVERNLLRSGPAYSLYRGTPRLSGGFEALARLVENLHRQSVGTKRMLQFDESLLPAGLGQHLITTLRPKLVRHATPVEVQFDEQTLSHILTESAATQDLLKDLLSAEDSGGNQETVKRTPQPVSAEGSQIPAAPGFEDLFRGSSEGSLVEMFAALAPEQIAFLGLFATSPRVEKSSATQFVRDRGAMLVSFVDGINEAALDPLGDILLDEDDDHIWVTQPFQDQFQEYWHQKEGH